MQEFGITYASADEEFEKFQNFIVNLKLLINQNVETPEFQLGFTQFNDMTLAEFKAKILTNILPSNNVTTSESDPTV